MAPNLGLPCLLMFHKKDATGLYGLTILPPFRAIIVCHLLNLGSRYCNQYEPRSDCYLSMVAQWLAHVPLVLEVLGSIPTRCKENFGVQTRVP